MTVSSHLAHVWQRTTDLEVVAGSGCVVRTVDGDEYLDFTSGIGVASTGHCHPRVVDAIREQAAKIVHAQVSCYRSPLLESLATRLAGITPDRIDRFFVTNSGAEATESAVKLARYVTGRPNVIVMDGGFHGRTYLAMAMTTSKVNVRAEYPSLPAGVFVAPFPRAYEWNVDVDTAVARSLEGLRRLFTTQTPPSQTAAIVMEPVLGEGGYVPAPLTFVRAVRDLCDDHDIPLVVDEVQTGFGRTGRMFAIEHADVEADVMVMAKGIASGFPISAIGARRDLMERWPPGAHGGTYGGNPVGCAAALATIDTIIDEGLADNAAVRGQQLLDGLHVVQANYPGIADVRGVGLMVGVELEKADGSPDPARAAAVLAHCLDRHRLILLTCGTQSNVVRFVPPLVVRDDEIDRCLAAFKDAISATALR